MALIGRLGLPKGHTIREFRVAAGLRYREATRLATVGDRLAAVYLCGYAVEMILKAAYFRFIGKGAVDPITMAEISDAKKYAITTLHLTWPGNLHDLPGWATLLVEERKLRHMPYSPGLSSSVLARVRRVYLNWRGEIRYRANRPYRGEVDSTIQAAFWFLSPYRFL